MTDSRNARHALATVTKARAMVDKRCERELDAIQPSQAKPGRSKIKERSKIKK
ncbi:MAG: hypothetical protein ACPGPS_05375 [Rubripirellula sp.]